MAIFNSYVSSPEGIYDSPWKPERVQTLKLMAPARPLGARVPGLIPGTTKRVSSAEGAAVGIADISPMQLCWIISPRCEMRWVGFWKKLHSFEGWYWWYWWIVFSHTGPYTQCHPISSRIHARCMRSDGPAGDVQRFPMISCSQIRTIKVGPKQILPAKISCAAWLFLSEFNCNHQCSSNQHTL